MTTRALIENVSRRRFLTTAATAAGFVVAAQMVPFRSAFAYETGADKMPHGVVTDPHVWVSIDPSGIVTITAHRSEMGTGSRTSVPLVVAEEMDADWSKVRIVQAPGDEIRYGNQDTDGSRSMRHFIQPMRAGRCLRAPDARAGRRQAVERAGRRGRGQEPRGHPHRLRQARRLRRARPRRRWTCRSRRPTR